MGGYQDLVKQFIICNVVYFDDDTHSFNELWIYCYMVQIGRYS